MRHASRARTRARAPFARGRAQAIPEYLVALAVVGGVFALPLGGEPPLILQFADAVGDGFARFLHALALPL